MTVRFSEIVGNASANSFVGDSFSIHFGLGGNDTFRSAPNGEYQLFVGGSGNDTYRIDSAGVMVVADFFGGSDTVVATGINPYSDYTFAATFDGRHLAVGNILTGQEVWVLDWRQSANRIETIYAAGHALSHSDLVSLVSSAPNYLGDFTWEEVGEITAVGDITDAEIDEAIAFYKSRAAALEAAPPPPPKDTTPPGAPSRPDLLAIDDTGSSNGDNVTRTTSGLTFVGTAEPGSTVRLFDDGVYVGSGTANASTGRYAISINLSEGVSAITARATDAAGNTGAASPALTVVVDRTPPGRPSQPDLLAVDDNGSSSADNITSLTTGLTFVGTAEPGVRVHILVDGTVAKTGTANGSTGYVAFNLDLSPGTHQIAFRAEDAAGNLGGGSAALSVTIDPNAANGLQGTSASETLDGTSGDDRIFGMAGDDEIVGGAGDDTLEGGDGDDVIKGGLGADRLVGGAGFDMADYTDAPAGMSLDFFTGRMGSPYAEGDEWVSIEQFRFSNFNDQIRGGRDNDIFKGGDGDDRMSGLYGDDDLSGEAGRDVLIGDVGDDRLSGGDDNDRLYGGTLSDTLFGDAGADLLAGGAHDDQLRGGDDNDRLYGGRGDDILSGQDGHDALFGGDGDDYIQGHVGYDRLYGGAGADTFYFEVGFNTDRLFDFDWTEDRLAFARDLGVTTSADVIARAAIFGDDAGIFFGVMAIGAENSVTLYDFAAHGGTLSDLEAAIFIL